VVLSNGFLWLFHFLWDTISFFGVCFVFRWVGFQVENSVKGCKVESLERKSADFTMAAVSWELELAQ
jgi:hypothetical protein